jgi:hypothetical protein
MAVQRKTTKPIGITNEAGQPEIVLQIDGLTISMTPPGAADATETNGDDQPDPPKG